MWLLGHGLLRCPICFVTMQLQNKTWKELLCEEALNVFSDFFTVAKLGLFWAHETIRGWTKMVCKMTQRWTWVDLENGMWPSGRGLGEESQHTGHCGLSRLFSQEKAPNKQKDWRGVAYSASSDGTLIDEEKLE